MMGVVEDVFGEVSVMSEEEYREMGWSDEGDEVQVFEPIMVQKAVKCRINFIEGVIWTVKDHVTGHAGHQKAAAKINISIIDDSVRTEHEEAKFKTDIDYQFNLDRYPYISKKTGEVAWMGRSAVFQLEEAFGFEPVFVNAIGDTLEPYITRNGKKVAPKVEGAKRIFNKAFFGAYFNTDDTINPDNWIDKEVYADIGIERSEQYGDRNVIQRFVKKPETI